MQPRSLTRFIASALVAATIAASHLKGDDVNELLKKAESAYESGDYSNAISSLDHAGQLIRQKKGEAMVQLLPAPLKGWEAEEATSESTGGAMFGGMVVTERNYTKGDSSVVVKIATDSPLLSSIMGMYTNPLFGGGTGAKMEMVNGQKALVNYEPGEKSGDANVVVADRILVTVEGTDVSRDDLIAYAKAVDYEKLSALK